jgi:hydroxysqualene synthase
LTGKFKTDVRMPTQSGPLEGQAVDNHWGGDETDLPEMLPANIGESEMAPATVAPCEPYARAEGSVETPSGKSRGGENFPVGSWLIRRDLRVHVHTFYRFARNADDVADNPTLMPADKLRRLDRMAAVLDGAAGDDAPAAAAMRKSLLLSGLTAEHCHDILQAFRQDAEKRRYRDWNELMGYCRYSAAPVGRQLLDLHGESRATWEASDALCAALQVLNHLQDCADDYCRLDRVYLPIADLAAAGTTVEALVAPSVGSGLRQVLDLLLDRTALLVAGARRLPAGVAARGLRCECAVIVELAARLLARLRRGDPLANRVGLGKTDFLLAFALGFVRGARR